MPSSLFARLGMENLPVQAAVPMAGHTSLRVGGPAALWLSARGEEDILRSLRAARAEGASITLVGNGSNLLVRDGGIDGLTLCVGQDMAAITVEGEYVRVQAGARLAQVALAAQAAGLAGMEAISGIPGTVGGALCMNAGSYGVEIAQLVEQVRVLDDEGNAHTLTAAEMDFGYRHSLLMQRRLIATEATLRLTTGDPAAIRQAMRAYAGQRQAKQPLTLPSAGSFFKRPEGAFAGALVEEAGLKGYTIGGAQVSPKHAGFLVNIGEATAADFLALMRHIQAVVYERTGIQLEPEVQILGCDSSC